MPKTMEEWYKAYGPQGWPEDPLTDDEKLSRIQELKEQEEDLLGEIENAEYKVEEAQDELAELEEELFTLREELKKLRGNT